MGANISSNDDFVADINVTPFVDVMLVLLIIFMVTAPMMTEGLEVELPKVKAAEVLPTESDHMILSIKNDGSIFLDEAALKAARKTRFIPGKVNGNKVNTVVLIPYQFSLR